MSRSGATSPADRLTHLDETGAASMVDVGDKAETSRLATAEGFVRMRRETFALIRDGQARKGDVVGIARVAGIMAAKRTWELVPLCHPISLSSVVVDLALASDSVLITATVRTTDRTGVEMEALTAVSVAGLTLHDMVKSVDPAATLDAVRVERKEGGKSGLWERP